MLKNYAIKYSIEFVVIILGITVSFWLNELSITNQDEKERIKILSANVEHADGPPGTVMDDKLIISCGVSGLKLKILQRAGKNPMTTAEFLRGFDLSIGTKVN